MPLGDSITWGVGSSNGYRAPLRNALTAEGHSLDFVGSGRNGTMSDPDNEGSPAGGSTRSPASRTRS